MHIKPLTTPFTDDAIQRLKAGDAVTIDGILYTARDAAHKRLVDMLAQGKELPVDFSGQAVYYAGPCPNRPGRVIGPVGPTTSGRMDAYAPALMAKGMKVMIGKGTRSQAVIDAIKAMGGIYFAAVGGAGALLSQCVTGVRLAAFGDLGTEAIYELTVRDFPAVVAIDTQGKNIYDGGGGKWITGP